ncbi:MAG: hypothetical protein Kow0069_38990 [Promethearchaeota archaeon]
MGGPYEKPPDNGFGIAHFEMIIPSQWFTGLTENYWDPLLHESAVMLREAGITWNRFEFAWSYVQPEAGVWVWDDLDAYLNVSDHYGLRILPVVAYGTPWACEGGDYLAPVTNQSAWREFVRTLVLRYKDRPSLDGWWQVWNEANIDGFFHGKYPEEFIPTMVAAAEEIKAADPGARVVANALTGRDMGALVTEMVDAVGRERFNELFDAVDVHPYAGTIEEITSKIRSAKDALAGWYSGELWITEVGWSTSGRPPLALKQEYQAQIIGKALVQSRALSVTHAFVHMWCDWGWVNGTPKVQDPDNAEHWFGIVDAWANPKPAYYAYKVTANLLGRSTYLGDPVVDRGPLSGGVVVHAFQHENGSTIFSYWSAREQGTRFELEGPLQGRFQVLDSTGRVVGGANGTREIGLEASSSLSFVVFTPQWGSANASAEARDWSVGALFTWQALVVLVMLPTSGVAAAVGAWRGWRSAGSEPARSKTSRKPVAT